MSHTKKAEFLQNQIGIEQTTRFVPVLSDGLTRNIRNYTVKEDAFQSIWKLNVGCKRKPASKMNQLTSKDRYALLQRQQEKSDSHVGVSFVYIGNASNSEKPALAEYVSQLFHLELKTYFKILGEMHIQHLSLSQWSG